MIYEAIIKKGDLVYDIGANIGNRSEMFLALGARVVAVEPQLGCITSMEKRFRNRDVIIVPKALGDANKQVDFYVASKSTVSSCSKKFVYSTKKNGRFKKVKWYMTVAVEMTTLDDVIREHGVPSFCKIDVEGSEKEILMGLSVPIPIISFEFTPEIGHDSVMCIERLLEIDSGYVFNYSALESLKFTFNKWVCSREMIGFLTPMIKNKVLTFGDVYAKIERVL